MKAQRGTPEAGDFGLDALRAAVDEVARLKQRVAAVAGQQNLESFDGFGHLLEVVLPQEEARVTLVALALRLRESELRGLAAGELDPAALPRSELASLGQVLGLSRDTFLHLVVRDHRRFASLDEGLLARSDRETAIQEDCLSEWGRFMQAWERSEADSPRGL